MAMDKALAELIRISNTVGVDKALVQAGGGNTSVKTEDGAYMFIKASGTALKDMDERRGWRRICLEPVLSIIKDQALANQPMALREGEVVNRLLLACEDDVKDLARPSVEAHLHAFLDKCVIHLHPDAVGAYVNTKEGRTLVDKLFSDEQPPVLWVTYVDPGFMLAKHIGKLVWDYQKKFKAKPQILFLEKHGLFVTAATADKALELVNKVIKRCSEKLEKPKTRKEAVVDKKQIEDSALCIRKSVFEATGQYAMVSFSCDDTTAGFMQQPKVDALLAAGVITPDELVYANGPAVWLDGEKLDSKKIAAKITSQLNKGAKAPAAFLVDGAGLFVAGPANVASAVRDIATSSFFIRVNAAKLGGVATLNKRQQDFINQWESEAFRKALTVGKGAGELKDRIAIVTGAGSGLGRSIAMGLVRAGAAVAIADVDVAAAEETAAVIKKEMPKSYTHVVKCDVTSEESVDAAFSQVLETWGGLDILVNAAGVAPAYPLVDTPVNKWRFALEVNLTGYFLMARAAARIMIRQGMGGAIVNISSKSGLEASKNNTAYNATKAGELHMARGWAMELGEYGIRVNCVCPGNVFEGSKIWNPAYIKECAKKYGIKPEEVIPFYVNKTTLKREIKGQDVADSVVFLCSDKSRTMTGQILVPDGGQALVR